MNKQAFAIVLGWAAFAQPAQAADIATSTPKAGKIIVTLTGDIVDGDAEKVRRLIESAQDRGGLVYGIRLDSIGGKLMEAVKIADIVHAVSIATAVDEAAECASACFIIFAAGNGKFAHYGARIGVNGASGVSNEAGRESVQSDAIIAVIARLFREMDVPRDIIGRMVVTPSQQMMWLTPDELRSMGVTMVGRPTRA
jgi:hypothetical protein